VKIPYIGLANIVIGNKLYPELLQKEMMPEHIAFALEKIHASRTKFRDELSGISHSLRLDGSTPSERVAERLLA
jgi:lipid A disaccharide synthetase